MWRIEQMIPELQRNPDYDPDQPSMDEQENRRLDWMDDEMKREKAEAVYEECN